MNTKLFLCIPVFLIMSFSGFTKGTMSDTITLQQHQLGNIFYDTEKVIIPCACSTVSSVSWTVKDYWNITVKTGVTRVLDGIASIEPNIGALGYFEIQITSGTQTITTTFAVVANNSEIDASSAFGAMTHFGAGWDLDIIPLIAKCGIRNVRDEIPWLDLEVSSNKYEFVNGEINFDAFMKAFKTYNIKPLIIMDFGNHLLYDNFDNSRFTAPYSDKGRLGFARYGKAILDKYGSEIIGLDVWNEYNGAYCVGPAVVDKPKYYSEMIKKVNDIVHPAYGSIPLLGTASVGVPKGYIHNIFTFKDALKAFDAVAIHPYSPLKASESELSWLKQEILNENEGIKKPIWATEFGNIWDYQTNQHKVASYDISKALYMCAFGVEKMFVYLFRDHDIFNGMGLVRNEYASYGKYTPYPLYPAYSNLIKQMYGATFVSKETLGSSCWANVFLFDRLGKQLRACWTEEPNDTSITFNTNTNLIKIDIMGVQTTLVPKNGKITLLLSHNPVYIIGFVNSVTMNSKLPITDSDLQYSMHTQGLNNWYYGYYDGTGNKPYTDTDFKKLSSSLQESDYVWGNNSYEWLVSSLGTQHPSNYMGKQVWNVKRYVSTISGEITIKGNFEHEGDNNSDGVIINVLVDGVIKFSKSANGSKGIFDITTKVNIGSKIDFCVTPGPNVNINSDNTQLNARIYYGKL